jgi:hypothetical protein
MCLVLCLLWMLCMCGIGGRAEQGWAMSVKAGGADRALTEL